MTNRFEHITTEASSDEECANRCELAWFHMWNPSGACAEFEKAADAIDAAIDAKRCANGAYLAYGHGNSYHYEQLMHLCRIGRRAKVWNVSYHVNGLRENAVKAYAFLATLA